MVSEYDSNHMSDFISTFLTLPGQARELTASSTLFHQGDAINYMFLVRTGEIELVRHMADGQAMVLQRAGAGMMLAEASAYTNHYHCRADVVQDSLVYQVPVQDFLAHLENNAGVAMQWGKYLAKSVQQARFRSELLTRKTVAQRLDTWLADGKSLPPKGHWQGLAKELGISHEALYREFAKRR